MEQAMDALAAGAAGDWVEVFTQQMDAELGVAVAPVQVRRHIMDRQPPAVEWGNGCRCWRCFPGTGGVALTDRPVLDRLLGQHLARLSPNERMDFFVGWVRNPHHDRKARMQLEGWVRIALGSKEPEPTYEVTR